MLLCLNVYPSATPKDGSSNAMRHPTKSNESGFSLIELLVVLGIIGILAAIALPSYSTYKTRAVDTMMQSDLRGARNAMEAFYESSNFTYEDVTEADLAARGFRESPSVTLDILFADGTSYQLRACADGGSSVSLFYDSDTGVAVPQNVACS